MFSLLLLVLLFQHLSVLELLYLLIQLGLHLRVDVLECSLYIDLPSQVDLPYPVVSLGLYLLSLSHGSQDLKL